MQKVLQNLFPYFLIFDEMFTKKFYLNFFLTLDAKVVSSKKIYLSIFSHQNFLSRSFPEKFFQKKLSQNDKKLLEKKHREITCRERIPSYRKSTGRNKTHGRPQIRQARAQGQWEGGSICKIMIRGGRLITKLFNLTCSLDVDPVTRIKFARFARKDWFALICSLHNF